MRFVAGKGAAAESHREYVAGRGAVAESLCGRGCRSAEADAAPTEELAAAAAKHSVAPSGSTCGQGEAHAGKEKQCWQGEAVRAGRSTTGREKQCGLLIDEDGEVVPSEYLLRHSLEL